DQGARIISCSLIMPSWSDGEGCGPVHDTLSRLFGDGTHPKDMLCFASAGNTALRHWSGAFHAERDGWHEWKPGVIDNQVMPWGNDRLSIELYWPAAADFDLVVLEAATGREIGASRAQPGVQRHCATVRFDTDGAHSCRVRLREVHGI